MERSLITMHSRALWVIGLRVAFLGFLLALLREYLFSDQACEAFEARFARIFECARKLMEHGGATYLALIFRLPGDTGAMENSRRDAIAAVLEARMRSFESAERSRDPERLLAHYASVPDFLIYHDGRRGTYDAMAAGVRGGLPALWSLEVTYGDLQVSLLSAESALVSATFRREMVVESTGAASLSEGAVSWLWRNIDGQWLIVFGHISHPLGVGK